MAGICSLTFWEGKHNFNVSSQQRLHYLSTPAMDVTVERWIYPYPWDAGWKALGLLSNRVRHPPSNSLRWDFSVLSGQRKTGGKTMKNRDVISPLLGFRHCSDYTIAPCNHRSYDHAYSRITTSSRHEAVPRRTRTSKQERQVQRLNRLRFNVQCSNNLQQSTARHGYLRIRERSIRYSRYTLVSAARLLRWARPRCNSFLLSLVTLNSWHISFYE